MRWFWTIAIGVALLAFEIGFVSNFRHLGGGPDFVLLFVIFLALYGPMDDAPISGWILGLARDSLSGGVFGLYAVLYMALGFFLSRIRADIFLEYNASHIVNAAASTLLVYVGSSLWHWTETGGFFLMLPLAFTVSLWNAFMAPLAFWFFFKFSRFLDTARRPG